MTVSLFECDRVALTTYKVEFYTKLPGYGSRGYIMTNANNQIMKLEDYKSVYMFDINGWGFTNVNFYLPTMNNGRKFRIVDTAGYMNNSKYICIVTVEQI